MTKIDTTTFYLLCLMMAWVITIMLVYVEGRRKEQRGYKPPRLVGRAGTYILIRSTRAGLSRTNKVLIIGGAAVYLCFMQYVMWAGLIHYFEGVSRRGP